MTHRWYLGEGDGGDEFISQRRKKKDERWEEEGYSSQGTVVSGGWREEREVKLQPLQNLMACFHR